MQEQAKFQHILFSMSQATIAEVDTLAEVQKTKLKRLFDQKIAFESVNRPNKAPIVEPQVSVNPSANTNFVSSACCCLFPENNREEFDITSEIFLKRVLGVTQFWKSGFLNVGGQKTELYGPIWMVATYVLTAGVAANLNSFFTTSYPFQFSNQPFYAIIGILIIVLGLQIFLYPAIIGCLGGFIKSNDSLALIGYSFWLYVVPTFFCSIPSIEFHYACLGFAALVRSIFLYRNFSGKIDSKRYLLLATFMFIEMFYLYIVYVALFKSYAGYTFSEGIAAITNSEENQARNTIVISGQVTSTVTSTHLLRLRVSVHL